MFAKASDHLGNPDPHMLQLLASQQAFYSVMLVSTMCLPGLQLEERNLSLHILYTLKGDENSKETKRALKGKRVVENETNGRPSDPLMGA